jgi:hypothetical protein
MRAVSTAASVVRHTVGAVGEALLVVAVVAALLMGVALVTGTGPVGTADVLAARGVIAVPDGVFAGTTTATVNPGGSDVWARGRCYQGGSLVYEEYVRVDANNRATLTLGPTANWTAGSASCTAEELVLGRNQRWHTLAIADFNVSD